MYIEVVPNRSSPPAVLLRQSYREGGKVKKVTLANFSKLPEEHVNVMRRSLRGERLVAIDDAFEIVRTLPHGHVAAVLGTARKLKLDQVISARRCRERDLVLAMIVARVIDPRSKLATARGLQPETALSSLSRMLHVEEVTEDDLYAAMDWLVKRQASIESKLARSQLADGTLVFYDVTSSYFEGRCCSLGKLGHSRDGKKGKLQIVYGLLCNGEGCPVAVEVFEGNTSDPGTLSNQIAKLRQRFGIERVTIVGDRGMLTNARIREELAPVEGLHWVTALRSTAIKTLLEQRLIESSLFDQQDLGEISSDDYPSERLIVCRNPLLAEERGRKREDLLQATERDLQKIVEAVRRERRPLRGKDKIGIRVGKVINRYKMGKHFELEIGHDSFGFRRKVEQIEAEASMDGLYVVRTNVEKEELGTEGAVTAYKGLSRVERAFRSLKTVDLKVRPIHHHLEDRVRAHVFLCMLAYYVQWHVRKAVAPLLFDDEDREGAEALRGSPVRPAQRSPSAEDKAYTKKTADGSPVHSFQTLLADLSTLALNIVRTKGSDGSSLTTEMLTMPTPIQQKALTLLGVSCLP